MPKKGAKKGGAKKVKAEKKAEDGAEEVKDVKYYQLTYRKLSPTFLNSAGSGSK